MMKDYENPFKFSKPSEPKPMTPEEVRKAYAQMQASAGNMGRNSPVTPESWRGRSVMDAYSIPLPSTGLEAKMPPAEENTK